MLKYLKWTLPVLLFVLLLPTLLVSASTGKTLAPVGNEPTAWLSAREGSKLYTHDLRVVLAIPSGTDENDLTVTLTFTGEGAPAAVSCILSELPLYRTVQAGGTV